MKIAIVGCGALGSFYGAKLCQAGHEVHCLLRSDYQAVRSGGIQVESVDGDFVARPRCARSPEEIGPADVVLVALKTTANAVLPVLLPALVGRASLVVSLENGLGDEEAMAAVVGEERVLGGLCFVCLNRIAPGHVRHSAHGLIVLGEHGRVPQLRTDSLAETFRQAGIPCRVTPDLAKAHWEKLVWNIPFNGLGVAAVAGYDALLGAPTPEEEVWGPTYPTDRLLADPRWEALVRELMGEVLAAAQALGHTIPESFAEEQVERTRVMGAYKASTLLDYEQGKALELGSMFEEPLRRAEAVGAATPRLRALCGVLSRLDRGQVRAEEVGEAT